MGGGGKTRHAARGCHPFWAVHPGAPPLATRIGSGDHRRGGWWGRGDGLGDWPASPPPPPRRSRGAPPSPPAACIHRCTPRGGGAGSAAHKHAARHAHNPPSGAWACGVGGVHAEGAAGAAPAVLFCTPPLSVGQLAGRGPAAGGTRRAGHARRDTPGGTRSGVTDSPQAPPFVPPPKSPPKAPPPPFARQTARHNRAALPVWSLCLFKRCPGGGHLGGALRSAAPPLAAVLFCSFLPTTRFASQRLPLLSLYDRVNAGDHPRNTPTAIPPPCHRWHPPPGPPSVPCLRTLLLRGHRLARPVRNSPTATTNTTLITMCGHGCTYVCCRPTYYYCYVPCYYQCYYYPYGKGKGGCTCKK